MGEEHIITKEEAVFPSCPFLFLEEPSVGNSPFIVERWIRSRIEVLEDCRFVETFKYEGHEATEEEIKKFMEGEYK